MSDQLGWGATTDQTFLESIIAQKSEKLKKYKKHIFDVRLLIVSDRIYNSGKAGLAAPVQCQSLGFRAVYYLFFSETAWQIDR